MSSFNSLPKAELLSDGRLMRLIEDFVFYDSNGRVWIAPEGSIVDGASIPKFFWRIIGPPLTGKYRNASIIHDVYCNKKTRPWQDVHWVFYEAMICSKVNPMKARLIYLAVYLFGPKWD